MGFSPGIDEMWHRRSANFASSRSLLWSSDILTDWYYPSTSADGNELGGPQNSGTSSSADSTDHAHNGSSSVLCTITRNDVDTSGVRLFRWGEPQQNRELWLSAWYWLPQVYTLTFDPGSGQFYNIMQIKSRGNSGTGNGRIDPVWAVRIENNSGNMQPFVQWGGGGYQLAGPASGDNVSAKQYRLGTQPTLPINQWFKVEYHVTQSTGGSYDGSITITCDGTELVNRTSINTGYVYNGFNAWQMNQHWSADMYSDGTSPNPGTQYIDHGEIYAPS